MISLTFFFHSASSLVFCSCDNKHIPLWDNWMLSSCCCSYGRAPSCSCEARSRAPLTKVSNLFVVCPCLCVCRWGWREESRAFTRSTMSTGPCRSCRRTMWVHLLEDTHTHSFSSCYYFAERLSKLQQLTNWHVSKCVYPQNKPLRVYRRHTHWWRV